MPLHSFLPRLDATLRDYVHVTQHTRLWPAPCKDICLMSWLQPRVGATPRMNLPLLQVMASLFLPAASYRLRASLSARTHCFSQGDLAMLEVTLS